MLSTSNKIGTWHLQHFPGRESLLMSESSDPSWRPQEVKNGEKVGPEISIVFPKYPKHAGYHLNILNIMRILPFETCPVLPLVCVLQARNRAPKIAYRWEAAGLPLQPIRASVAQASPFGRLCHVSSAGSLGPGVAPETQRLPTKLANGIYSGDSRIAFRMVLPARLRRQPHKEVEVSIGRLGRLGSPGSLILTFSTCVSHQRSLAGGPLECQRSAGSAE
jgi:hypothetical protein